MTVVIFNVCFSLSGVFSVAYIKRSEEALAQFLTINFFSEFSSPVATFDAAYCTAAHKFRYTPGSRGMESESSF